MRCFLYKSYTAIFSLQKLHCKVTLLLSTLPCTGSWSYYNSSSNYILIQAGKSGQIFVYYYTRHRLSSYPLSWLFKVRFQNYVATLQSLNVECPYGMNRPLNTGKKQIYEGEATATTHIYNNICDCAHLYYTTYMYCVVMMFVV